MKRLLLLTLAIGAPGLAGAQDLTIASRGTGPASALLDSAVARPHVLRTGTGRLELARDTTLTTSLIVVGRDTYLASTVRGDVIVVGGDLYLRPGSDISGRAIAIGGTVATTTLGRVGGEVHSLRDETFDIVAGQGSGAGVVLAARSLREGGTDSLGIFRLAGVKGLMFPSYDRVDGLSLPVGLLIVPGDGSLVLTPTVTYRSRLGAFDPGVAVRVGPAEGSRLELRAGRETRSNDEWITGTLINSLKTFAFGTDTRNYFRSDLAEGRAYQMRASESSSFEPFVGARYERVFPITAAGNVYSLFSRADSGKTRRLNPLVEPGHVASVLAGAIFRTLPDDIVPVAAVRAELEQSVSTPAGTSNFTQLTLHGTYEFPTFSTQRLVLRGHAVGTLGDSVPRSRYAYLGGSRTLGLAALLEFGGDQLAFLDSRYLIPIDAVQLPMVGPPVVSLIHRIGGAGVGTLGALQQEVGAGLDLGPLSMDFIVGASGTRGSRFGVGVSMPKF